MEFSLKEGVMLGFNLNLTCFEQASIKKTWIKHS